MTTRHTTVLQRLRCHNPPAAPRTTGPGPGDYQGTELHRNPAVLAANGGHWKGLDDLELATCAWVAWFNEDRIHGELDDRSPAEVEAAHYRSLGQAHAA